MNSSTSSPLASPSVPAPPAAAEWWTDAVIYEVYPRSFADADGDGVGDLAGIAARIPYLADLGVQGVWLTPIQRSPQVDQGYDISDYCDIDPLFGDLAAFDDFLARAHAAGLKVLIDLVPNHTSVENVLFRRALAAAPGSTERELFHFRPGRAPESAPNNWASVFGGPAWSRHPEQRADDPEWYLHLFSPAQPDWNWDNPAVAEMFDGILRFWFDRGADGVRVDVAHGLFKADGLPDAPFVPAVVDGLRSNPLVMDQEPVHGVYRRWRSLADEYRPSRVLVGEVNLEPERAARYTRPDELHQSFAFAFAQLGWDAQAWQSTGQRLEQARREHGASITWALENHDIVRTAQRFGGGERGRRRSCAATVAMLGLPGGVYLFQGQELALPEAEVPEHARRDPMWQRGGVTRDGARVPVPWREDPEGVHGFQQTPQGASPWLPVPQDWGRYSVESQEAEPGSVLHRVRAAVRTRRSLRETGILHAVTDVQWRVHEGDLVECERGDGISIFLAMGEDECVLPAGEVLFRSDPEGRDGVLAPDSSAWVRRG